MASTGPDGVLTLTEVAAAIRSARPETLARAADAVRAASDALLDLQLEMSMTSVGQALVADLQAQRTRLDGWGAALRGAGGDAAHSGGSGDLPHPERHRLVDVGLGSPTALALGRTTGSRRTTAGPAPERLAPTSTGRLPGVGAPGYAPPPDAKVTIRSRGGGRSRPPAADGSGAGPAADPDRPAGRRRRPDADADWVETLATDGTIGRPPPSRPGTDG